MENIEKMIKRKKEQLEKIRSSAWPINPALWEAHERRADKAFYFLIEIREITSILNLYPHLKLVNIAELRKEMAQADFANIDFDGQFCKLVQIQNCLQKDRWLLYVAPVTSI